MVVKKLKLLLIQIWRQCTLKKYSDKNVTLNKICREEIAYCFMHD